MYALPDPGKPHKTPFPNIRFWYNRHIMMTEIIEKCEALEVSEKRSLSESYYEIVFFSEQVKEWVKILSDILGPPTKPPGTKPSKEDDRLTDEYGGICKNQTLFHKRDETDEVVVMFWPWQDGEHTTLKMALVGK